MKSLKKTFLAAALVLSALIAVSCRSDKKTVEKTAEKFLTAYYAGDYSTAAQYCGPFLSRFLSSSAAIQNSVPGEIAEKMKEAVEQTSFKIVSCELDKESGEAVVRYEITTAGIGQALPKMLRLKLEGRTARVNGIE